MGSIAALLKEMRGDIKEIKNDNRDIKTNMQDMNAKIISIEKKQHDSEQITVNELHEIRNEVRGNKEKLEESITANVIHQIDPIIKENKNQITANDVQRIVEDAMNKMNTKKEKEAVPQETSEDETENVTNVEPK